MMREDKQKEVFRERAMHPPFVSRSLVPSGITAVNMVCGYIAIILTGAEAFVAACVFIIAAALLDAADGFVARLVGASSRFGFELDSLSDLISFGAAPAYLVYKFGLEDLGMVQGVFFSSLLVVGSGIRLARFNTAMTSGSKGSYCGLPTPAQALAVVGFVLWMDGEDVLLPQYLHAFLSGLTVFLALLMVSRIRYNALPEPTLELVREKPLQAALYPLVITALLIYQAKALFLAMLLYILLGLIRSASLFFREVVFQR